MKGITQYIKENQAKDKKCVFKFDQKIITAKDAVKKYKHFKLFRDNFKKNKGGFPNIAAEDVKIGVAKFGKRIVGLIAYAYPKQLVEYRKADGETESDYPHEQYGHIFDVEVELNKEGKSKHKGLGQQLILGAIEAIERHGNNSKGVTLQAINQKVAKYYEKLGFETYEPAWYKNMDDDEKKEFGNPPIMMEKHFKVTHGEIE